MKTLGLAFIGCGEIAHVYARLLASPRSSLKSSLKAVLGRGPGTFPHPVRLIAACDSDRARAEVFRHEYGFESVTNDYRDIASNPDIDAVFICTPPSLHPEMSIACTERKKHVFCEKPMAMNSADCSRMVESAQKNNALLQVAYVLRYSSERMKIRELLPKIKGHGPIFWREVYHPRSGPHQPWVMDEKTGGGPLFENSHCLDFIRSVLGDPSHVSAARTKVKHRAQGAGLTAQDSFSVQLNFNDGSVAVLSDTYALPGLGWEKTAERKSQVTIDILGEHGALQFPSQGDKQALSFYKYEGDELGHREEFPWTSDWGANGYREQLLDFFSYTSSVAGTASTQKPKCDGVEGMRTLELLETIVKSAELNQTLPFKS